MCPRQRTTHAAATIVEESNKRRERVVTRIDISLEAARNFAARVDACVEEAFAAVSPQRLSLRREEVMEKLESTIWLGRVIALQCLLGFVNKISIHVYERIT